MFFSFKGNKLPEDPHDYRMYDTEGSECWEVETILDKKYIRSTRSFKYLVKWKGWGLKESTWEPVDNLEGALDMLIEFEKNYAEVVVPFETAHFAASLPDKPRSSRKHENPAKPEGDSTEKKQMGYRTTKKAGGQGPSSQKNMQIQNQENSNRFDGEDSSPVHTESGRFLLKKTSSSSDRSKKATKKGRVKNQGSSKGLPKTNEPIIHLSLEEIESPEIRIEPFGFEEEECLDFQTKVEDHHHHPEIKNKSLIEDESSDKVKSNFSSPTFEGHSSSKEEQADSEGSIKPLQKFVNTPNNHVHTSTIQVKLESDVHATEQSSHSCTFENTNSNIFEMAQGFDAENSKGFEHSSSSIISNSKNLLQDFERPVSSFQANRGFTKFKGVGELANKKTLDIAGFVGFCSPSIEIKPFDDSDDDDSDGDEHNHGHKGKADGKDDKQHQQVSSVSPVSSESQHDSHPLTAPLQVRQSLFSSSRNSTMIIPKDVAPKERDDFSHSESLPAKVVKPTVLVLGGVNQIAQQRNTVSSTQQTFQGWLTEFYTMMRANSMPRFSNPMMINRQFAAVTPAVVAEKKKRGRRKKSESENRREVDKSALKELDREAKRDESVGEGGQTRKTPTIKKEKKKAGVPKQRRSPKKEAQMSSLNANQIQEEAGIQSQNTPHQIELEEPAKPAAADGEPVDKQKFVENLLCTETDLQADQVADVEFFSWDGAGTRNPASYFFKVKWKPRPDGAQKPPSIVPWEELKAHAASNPGLINPGIFNEA